MSRPDSKEWEEAIQKELNALTDMGVFTEMELPTGAHALGTTWAFRRKTNEDDVVTKYKARLCAQGFSQIPGLDYNKTYAPTGRAASMRLALSVCESEDLEVRLMDAVGAFLNGIPEEVLYIKIPQGYSPKTTGKNIVLLLNRSLYGLKQSPRCWYNMVKDFFASINFKPSQSDPCLFISKDPAWRCFVHVHVDDMLVMGTDTQRFSTLIQQRFKMEDMGECSFYLGMRMERDRAARTITLTQDKYILNMLDEYGMTDCHPVSTPMVPGSYLTPATDVQHQEFLASGLNYNRAVGLLNYLVMCTRPDLAFTAGQLAQQLKKPSLDHWAAFKRVLRYLQGTHKNGLVLGGGPINLKVYADSDYAGCPVTRRSTTGYIAQVGGGCVSWRSRKQTSVSTSSTEAEYRAAYEASQEAIWLRRVLEDLRCPQQQGTPLLCDNQSSLALQKNPLFKDRSKHFEVHYHWVREKVDDGTISPTYVPTAEMLADICTKSLPRPQHQYLVNLFRS